MSENARPAANPVVITLIIVVVVLAAGLGYLIWKNNNSVPAIADVSSGSNTGSSTTTSPTAGTGTSGAASIVPADFDAKAATKVPSGTTPEKWVEQYYVAADKGDWETAFKHIPAAKQAGSSPDALKQQVASYGITGYKITSAQEQGDQATVIVDQQTSQYGTFENTWIFKKVGDTWLVAGKAVTGMK